MKEPRLLSQVLLDQMSVSSGSFQFTDSSPVLSVLPPFLLKELPENIVQKTPYHFQEFSGAAELKKAFPEADLRRGHPREIHRFLSGSEGVFLDFDQLGCVYLSRESNDEERPVTRMALWLNYALSPELWGTEGKWTRFHERLHKLFEKQNLLEGIALPGYYPLKPQARSWSSLNISGDLSDAVFALVLPWTFSLSDLRKLESLLNEEN